MVGRIEKAILISSSLAAAASGCVQSIPPVVGELEAAVVQAAERMDDPGKAKVAPAKVNDAKGAGAAAEQLLRQAVEWYGKNIENDGTAIDNNDGDVASLVHFMERTAALKANPLVQRMNDDSHIKKVLNQAETLLTELSDFYRENIWNNMKVRVVVDAVHSSGRKLNYGRTDEAGGYVVNGSIDDVKYAIWAAQLVKRNPTTEKVEAIIEELKLGESDGKRADKKKFAKAQEYLARPDVQRKKEEAEKKVKELKQEALTKLLLTYTNTELREKYSTQLSYRQAVGIVTMLSEEDWQRTSIQALDADGRPIKVVYESVDTSGIVSQVHLTDEIKKKMSDMKEASLKLIGTAK